MLAEEALRSVSRGLALLSQHDGFLNEKERRLWWNLQQALAEWLSAEKPTNSQSDRLLSAYVDLEAQAIYEMGNDREDTSEGEILTDWLLSRTLDSYHPFLVACERMNPSDISPRLIGHFRRDLRAIEELAKPKWVKFIESHCKAFYASDQWEERCPDGLDSQDWTDRRELLTAMRKKGDWEAFWEEIGVYVHTHQLPPFRAVEAFSICHKPVVHLRPISAFNNFDLDLLEGNEDRIKVIKKNTHCFVRGHKAHNVLIWGSRGGGKSSLVRGLICHFKDQGLRALEIVPNDYSVLPEIFEIIRDRPERYIGVLDNISLERGDPALGQLSRILEGGLIAMPDNLIFYATSNYKDLVDREGEKRQGLGVMQMNEDGGARNMQGKRPGLYDPQQHQRLDELRALDDRFALKVYVDTLRKEQYESVLFSYARKAGINCPDGELLRAFNKWSMRHNHDLVGGRTARDFIRYFQLEQLDLTA